MSAIQFMGLSDSGEKKITFNEARQRACLIFLKFISSLAGTVRGYKIVQGFDYGQKIYSGESSSWTFSRLFVDPSDFAYLQRMTYEDYGLILLNIFRGGNRLRLALFDSSQTAHDFVKKALSTDPDCFPHGQASIPSYIFSQKSSCSKTSEFSLNMDDFPALPH